MWVKTFGGKFVNMDNVSLVDINTSVVDSGRWQVESYLAGEDNSSVTLFVGSPNDCEEYMQKLGDKLSVQQVEMIRPEDIAKMAW